jgi:hypothetical protein
MRQLEIWSIHNFFAQRSATCHSDCLGLVKSLLTTTPSALAGFSAAYVFGLRQFVSGKVNHVVLEPLGPHLRMYLCQFQRKSYQQHNEQYFNPAGSQHAAVGK